jgi:hypothetical protein
VSSEQASDSEFAIELPPSITFRGRDHCALKINALLDDQEYLLEMDINFQSNTAERIAVTKIFPEEANLPNEVYNVYKDYPGLIHTTNLAQVMQMLPRLLGDYYEMTTAFMIGVEMARERYWESAENEKYCC